MVLWAVASAACASPAARTTMALAAPNCMNLRRDIPPNPHFKSSKFMSSPLVNQSICVRCPHPCDSFLSQGWDTSALNRFCHPERSAAESGSPGDRSSSLGWGVEGPAFAFLGFERARLLSCEGNLNLVPWLFAENNPPPAHTGREEKRIRTPSSIGETMRNLTVTIPGDAYRRRGSGQPNATLPLSAVVRHHIKTLPRSRHSPALSNP